MRTLFSVKNETGEEWPAFGMARLGAVLRYDGVNDDAPLYTLVKPDGEDGIYVVNGAAPLATAKEGTGIHYLDAQYIAVESAIGIEPGKVIGAVRKRWLASIGGICQMMAIDSANDDNIVPVTQISGQRIQVRMKDDLLAAVDTEDDPSQSDAYLLVKLANGKLGKTRSIKRIINRFQNISVDANSYAKAEMIDGEWQLYAADCPSDSSGASEEFVSE